MADPLADQCVLLTVYSNDAPGIFSIARTCCKAWREQLPQYSSAFGRALQGLRRLFALGPTSARVLEICELLLKLNHLFLEHVSVQTLLWQHQHVFWKLLHYGGVHFAWKVRRDAGLVLRDLGMISEYDDIKHKLMILQQTAQLEYDILECKREWPSIEYMTHAQSPLSFKAIQFNAAIVVGDVQWLLGQEPQTRNPRMFCVSTAESTPRAPSDSSESDWESAPFATSDPPD